LEHTPKTLRNKHRLKNIIKILLQKLRYTPDEKNIGQRKMEKNSPAQKTVLLLRASFGFPLKLFFMGCGELIFDSTLGNDDMQRDHNRKVKKI
jgi:hypothetical protein